MQLNLDELKSNFPLETLRTLLHRSLQQISNDATHFQGAIGARDFVHAGQLIHRTRGLALFLGVPAVMLDPIQATENELIAQTTRASPSNLDVERVVIQFNILTLELGALLTKASKEIDAA
jgi:hypothetical protein